ncbi:MAG TPA: (Fe-S)-binding protein [Rhodanobacteraceae bacterium]|nr:(Fe-S)-binding protein [Rhodanobacteraceae bacterium]
MASPDPAVRIAALADECVKCGLCLPHCPTYALDATETESPRGRIALAAAGTSGAVEPGHDLRLHLDHCLACLACERVCPVPVHYGPLIVETRAALAPAYGRPRLLLSILSRPRLLRIFAALARVTGARAWLPTLARALPKDSASRAAARVLAVAPPVSRIVRGGAPAAGSRTRVALFGGCVQGVYERDAQIAAVRLLQAAGFDVVMIENLCCGALAAHTGDAARAAKLMARVHEVFERSGAQVLLTTTSGCLGTLRAALPNTRVDDVLGFLAAHADALRFNALETRVALHLPCTQVNVARNVDAVRKLLARVPGLQVAALPTQAQCCGAAGSHMLEFPTRAAAYREKVLGLLPQPAPDMLLTSNIGCRLHFAVGLQERETALPVEHPLTLLAGQLKDGTQERAARDNDRHPISP